MQRISSHSIRSASSLEEETPVSKTEAVGVRFFSFKPNQTTPAKIAEATFHHLGAKPIFFEFQFKDKLVRIPYEQLNEEDPPLQSNVLIQDFPPSFREELLYLFVDHRLGVEGPPVALSDEDLIALYHFSKNRGELSLAYQALAHLTESPDARSHAKFLLEEIAQADWRQFENLSLTLPIERFICNWELWMHEKGFLVGRRNTPLACLLWEIHSFNFLLGTRRLDLNCSHHPLFNALDYLYSLSFSPDVFLNILVKAEHASDKGLMLGKIIHGYSLLSTEKKTALISKGLALLTKAADAKFSLAMRLLGDYHCEGIPRIQEDYQRAQEALVGKSVASPEFKTATKMNKLFLIHAKNRSDPEGIAWYTKAAKQGDPPSMHRLAHWYRARDQKLHKDWMEKYRKASLSD